MKKILSLLLAAGLLAATWLPADASSLNKRLGRGMNMGNMLEAPSEGEWGVKLDESYFALIKEKGFTMVRIPVRWSAAGRGLTSPPYTVDPAFIKRLDRAVDAALKNGLMVVLNWHHFEDLFKDPDGQHDRFVAVWNQISGHFKDYPDSLLFEIMNEPNGGLTAAKWNKFYTDVLAVIRKSNPTRGVVIGTAEWGGVGSLRKLSLPAGETNLILTVHYYSPFQFTHQGAGWVDGSEAWLGTKWNGTYYEKLAVINDMAPVAAWSAEHHIPVYVGEFGAFEKADMASRARWTSYCARLFERLGFSWSYWEFCSGFGIYDASTETWRDPLVKAMISDDTNSLKLGEPPRLKSGKKSKGDLIKNGDFAKGLDGWTFGAWKGRAGGSVGADGAFCVSITNAGNEGWNIQLLQNGLVFEDGHSYIVSFDAWADADRMLGSGAENAVSYANYGGTEVSLTKEKSSFVYRFAKSGGTDSHGRISFSLGGESPAVHIDNVKVTDMGR